MPVSFPHPQPCGCGICREGEPEPVAPGFRWPNVPYRALLIAAALLAVTAAVAFAVGYLSGYARWHHNNLECVHDGNSEACHTVQYAPSATPYWPAEYPKLCIKLEAFRDDAGAGCPR